MTHRFTVSTKARTDFVDVTAHVQKVLDTSEMKNGICFVFIPHTTAGVTINENADPDVKADIINSLERVVPWKNRYRHIEGNSAAHIKASLVGFSCSIPFENRRLVLGTWQCIYFCEFDGPRVRNVIVTLTGS
ncbi:MAG TPA: secondary thiamine-phosphate synthase enzyme YjbQ [Anaerolineae bacterium]|nr:secondary thiamine-phosphate synthase enzyme YjbQ [Anaerolineae bacterium]